jgi:hypothetical protein
MVWVNRFCRICNRTWPETRLQWTAPTGVDLHFSPISTPNQQCHSTWKVCPSTKYTTFVLGEFEVFRENLENAAKVPADMGGSIRSQGFLSEVLTKWTLVDQKVSLGFVGDVFGVMTLGEPSLDQSQHCWRGLINPAENLGRHTRQGRRRPRRPCSSTRHFGLALFDRHKLGILKLKCTQQSIRKL